MARSAGIILPQHVGEAAEINYSGQPAADFGPLARDKIPVRSMTEADLRALVTIDRRITGSDRAAYFQRKLVEALSESGSLWLASTLAISAESKPRQSLTRSGLIRATGTEGSGAL